MRLGSQEREHSNTGTSPPRPRVALSGWGPAAATLKAGGSLASRTPRMFLPWHGRQPMQGPMHGGGHVNRKST
jgi:hypothetical protein